MPIPAKEVDRVRREVRRLSREPFQQQLAVILGCAPSEEALETFAEKHPDRWAHTVKAFASLSGYVDRQEVDVNVTLDVSALSDMELRRRLAELEREARELERGSPLVIEATPVQDPPSPDKV